MSSRTKTVVRMVEHTRNGQTQLVAVPGPRVPMDWDDLALKAVYVMTTVIILGVVTWSAVGIGDLLSRVAPPWVAYTVAAVYDMAWVVCMTLEWLSRYDRDRAKVPKVAGWIALIISMVLISVHGDLKGYLWVGVAGAAVSLVAKGLWTVVLHHTSIEMSVLDTAYMKQMRTEATMEAAGIAEQRRNSRMREKLALQREYLGQQEPVPALSAAPAPAVEAAPSPAEEPEPAPVSSDDRRPSAMAFVRGLLACNPNMTRKDVLAAALPEYGMQMQGAVAKAYWRITSQAKQNT